MHVKVPQKPYAQRLSEKVVSPGPKDEAGKQKARQRPADHQGSDDVTRTTDREIGLTS